MTVQGKKMRKENPVRILISFDGDTFYLRRIAAVHHNAIRDEMHYVCDKPLGRKKGYASASEVMHRAKSIISRRRIP